jgi:hypothetical protein
MNKNRDLKDRVTQASKEYENICSLVLKLEGDNREYVKRDVGVDWNLSLWFGT